MDDALQRTTRGIVAAIKAEAEGHHFYRMASQATADPQGQRVFAELAEEELAHLQFLRAQHAALLSSGRPDAGVRLGQPHTFTGASPIFSPALRKRIAEAHFEMTALSVGIQLELSAQRFYREEASSTADQAVRQFFLDLAAWEAGHYQALLAQQDSLKEDYWAAAGFTPF